MIKRLYTALLFLIVCSPMVEAGNRIFTQTVRTLQVVVNDDWLSPPVMQLGSDDVLNIAFDELSHEYHRFIYRIEHCEADWTVSDQIFESDYLEGFNDNPIEDYQNSWNTTVLYTHYKLQIPNDRCRLKMSGNYRLTVIDEDRDGEKVFEAEFMVVEPRMNIGLEMTTNTDIDVNNRHQQIGMTLDYGALGVTNISEQIRTVVTQNGRHDNAKINVKPNIITGRSLQWMHNRDLIFAAGNEYRKYEILALSHPTMGIDRIDWNGHNYNVYPFLSEPRMNYLHDEGAKGAFYVRNSDNWENDISSDYVYVHYKMKAPRLAAGRMIVDGWWTTDSDRESYVMTYDETDGTYNATILQKQGYYSYQFLVLNDDGTTSLAPTEGCFYQTANRYQAYAYYKELGGRTWRLVGYRQIITGL